MKKIYNKGKWLDIINNKKYQDIRDKILSSFKELTFVEDGHKYYLHGKEIECVSNVTHQFQEHFDADSKAIETYNRNYNNPNSKYYKMSVNEIKEAWIENSKHACSHGTERHEFGESLFYFMVGDYDKILGPFKDRLKKDDNGDYYFEAIYPKEEAAAKFYEDMPRSIVPILAETKVYDEDLGYSGTFDLLCYYDAELAEKDAKESGLFVLDWKGLDIDTPILTKNGWKTIKDINEGDYVYDRNGNLTKVLHVSDIHMDKPCFKIEFNNDYSIICDYEHKWVVSELNNDEEVVKTTTELFFSNKQYGIRSIRFYEDTVGKHIPNVEINVIGIKKITPVLSIPTKCIEVDSATHTYLFGKYLLPTHNTNKDLYKNFAGKKLLKPFDELLDMPLNLYKLQLSLYQNCLEKIGEKVIARRIMWLLPNGEYSKIPLESYVKELRKALKKKSAE